MNIRQMLVPEYKYDIKCPYSMNPIGITVHNTANDASANNEISYMINNNYETSFHYAVDDIEVVQGIPLNRNAWHSSDGNGNGNLRTIAIEICYSKSGGERFDKAEQNAVKLIAKLLKDYGWGLDKVYTHMYFARDKKYCPHRTMDYGWNRFMNMIKAELDGVTNQPVPTDNIYRVRRSWEDAKSQKGAYKDLNNAKVCANTNKLNVYDKDGNLVYSSNSQPIPTPPPIPQPIAKSVTYQVHTTRGVWYPNVVNLTDYAGVFGQAIDCVYVSANVDIKTRVHIKGGNWLPWVNQRSDYAGIYGKAIDGIQIDSAHRVKYRVYVGGRWLPFVQNVTDYAGIYGQNIEGLQVVFE